jgi:2',3'-cyclic-nucleotide 2'-phosphodiesterase (5'-nucleotidase family)
MNNGFNLLIKSKDFKALFSVIAVLMAMSLLYSCSIQHYQSYQIHGTKIGVTSVINADTTIVNFIKPYKTIVDKEFETVLAYCPENLDKSIGEWQTNVGSFFAQIILSKSNQIFGIRENRMVDFCILNHGGIRAILPKGNLTARNAFEIMPFENTVIIASIKAEQVNELVNYMVQSKKPHPLAGLSFVIDKNNKPKSIKINNQPLDSLKTYHVATSDYLINGGDNMVFFKKRIQNYDIDYKIRNILIDYLKQVDTVRYNNEILIVKEY